MATFMQIVKKTPANFPHGTAQRGLKGVAIDKIERYGAMGAFSYLKTRMGEDFLVGSGNGVFSRHGYDAWIGGVGLLVAGALHAAGSSWGAHLERIADAGVMSAIGSIAASYGLEHAGKKVAVLTPGKMPKKIAGDVLGAVGAAKSGPYLSQDDMLRFMHARTA